MIIIHLYCTGLFLHISFKTDFFFRGFCILMISLCTFSVECCHLDQDASWDSIREVFNNFISRLLMLLFCALFISNVFFSRVDGCFCDSVNCVTVNTESERGEAAPHQSGEKHCVRKIYYNTVSDQTDRQTGGFFFCATLFLNSCIEICIEIVFVFVCVCADSPRGSMEMSGPVTSSFEPSWARQLLNNGCRLSEDILASEF